MIRTIIGMRGSGKTTLAERFVGFRQKPVIIVDLFEQFKGVRVLSADELLDHVIGNGGRVDISRPLVAQVFEEDDFHRICETAITLGNVLLVVDEIDFFDSPSSQDPAFKQIIHYGRHYNIDLVTTSRRPANISRDLTSQTSEFYIFKVHERRDLDYFLNLSSELPETIKRLQPYHYIRFDHTTINIMPPVRASK